MREMRRKDRAMGRREAEELLAGGEYGVLSTVDDDGLPYGVPLSYAYRDDTLYFHSALSGHKLDNILANPRVSFCVVGRTRVLQAKFSTEYESVIAFGTASQVTGEEKDEALRLLVEKYSPDFVEDGLAYIRKDGRITRVVKVSIDRISGKARR